MILKTNFEQERDFSVLKKIKSCLESSVDDNFLYFGFQNGKDLYIGQNIIMTSDDGLQQDR